MGEDFYLRRVVNEKIYWNKGKAYDVHDHDIPSIKHDVEQGRFLKIFEDEDCTYWASLNRSVYIHENNQWKKITLKCVNNDDAVQVEAMRVGP